MEGHFNTWGLHGAGDGRVARCCEAAEWINLVSFHGVIIAGGCRGAVPFKGREAGAKVLILMRVVRRSVKHAVGTCGPAEEQCSG